MIDAAAVRELALALPGATDDSDAGLCFSLGGKGFAWTYMQRVAAKKPRVARLEVLAVRCPLERKEMLIEAAPDVFFDDDHYRGYPAVLVRLEAVDPAEFAAMLSAAHAMLAAQKPRRRNPR